MRLSRWDQCLSVKKKNKARQMGLLHMTKPIHQDWRAQVQPSRATTRHFTVCHTHTHSHTQTYTHGPTWATRPCSREGSSARYAHTHTHARSHTHTCNLARTHTQTQRTHTHAWSYMNGLALLPRGLICSSCLTELDLMSLSNTHT